MANIELTLGDVQETALIPLAVKANETKRKNPRITDSKAVEIVEKLGIDTQKYDKFMSHEGVVARTILFDRLAKSFIEKYPDAVCINMGCGLDNRFERVDNGRILWYDIDLPDSIEVRRKAYEDTDRRKMISGSALENDWTSQIEKRRHTLVIMEGLLMYFSKEQVGTVLNVIHDNFEDTVLLCELMHPLVAGNSDKHDTVKNTGAKFGWGTKSGEELMPLCDGLKLIKEISFNEVMKKYTIRGFLFAVMPVIHNFNDRLSVFKLKGKSDKEYSYNGVSCK